MALHKGRNPFTGTVTGIVAATAFLALIVSHSRQAAMPAGSVQKTSSRPCIAIADTAQQTNKDVCVRAHVYDVITLADGTRFLDVCPPDEPDDQCHFTILSLPADREDVGDLRKYRDQDVQVRGIIHSTHGRLGIVLSHARQFSGGPEKFKPNPKLLRGFNGQSDRMPVHDPNLAASGRRRSFMNSSDKEELPARQKP